MTRVGKWNWPEIPPIREIGPGFPSFEPVAPWPKPEPHPGPYIKAPTKDGNPDESGDRAR